MGHLKVHSCPASVRDGLKENWPHSALLSYRFPLTIISVSRHSFQAENKPGPEARKSIAIWFLWFLSEEDER